MLNLILRSKKGNEISAGELLQSLAERNNAGGLSIHYVDRKPVLQYKSNPKGALEVITASVLFPMLMKRFELEKSAAFKLAGWLSENLGGAKVNPPAVEQQKPTLLTEEELEAKLLHKAMLISLLETIDKKMTKAEMLKVIEEAKSMIKDGE